MEFKKMLEDAIGTQNAHIASSAFERPSSVSVRLNPYKNFADFDDSKNVPWSEYGRILKDRPVFTLDPLFHAGTYYVQDSSSMYVGSVFRAIARECKTKSYGILKVLDLCAAPGGKTTDMAASLREICGDGFLLVANEVIKKRAAVLAENVALWGDENVVVTSDDPSTFASLDGYFDIILADVPCSGEGMFRKEEQARELWSVDNVRMCAARQRRILSAVIPALAEDGVLIYSTCTFNRYEDDENVEWAASEFGMDIVSDMFAPDYEEIIKTGYGRCLVPGLVPGEGQYCSVLSNREKTDRLKTKISRSGKNISGLNRKKYDRGESMTNCVRQHIDFLLDVPTTSFFNGNVLRAVPKVIFHELCRLEQTLHIVSSGCAIGSLKGDDFIPNPDLALSNMLSANAFRTIEVSKDDAVTFLSKGNISLPECETGYYIIKYCGANIGFAKNIGNRWNNLHPASRRIRISF